MPAVIHIMEIERHRRDEKVLFEVNRTVIRVSFRTYYRNKIVDKSNRKKVSWTFVSFKYHQDGWNYQLKNVYEMKFQTHKISHW